MIYRTLGRVTAAKEVAHGDRHRAVATKRYKHGSRQKSRTDPPPARRAPRRSAANRYGASVICALTLDSGMAAANSNAATLSANGNVSVIKGRTSMAPPAISASARG